MVFVEVAKSPQNCSLSSMTYSWHQITQSNDQEIQEYIMSFLFDRVRSVAVSSNLLMYIIFKSPPPRSN